MPRLSWGPLTTIRARLGAAVTLALVPVLLLGVAQATIAFRKDAEEQHANLVLAAVRSAATARSRLAGAEVLLQTLGPQANGPGCVGLLGKVRARVGGYDNLIRFDRAGRVVCAARSVPPDAQRGVSDWFTRLAAGDPSIAVRAPASLGAPEPALLAAGRVTGDDGDRKSTRLNSSHGM